MTEPCARHLVVSGRKMFELLSPALKSLAVRATVQYSPHPYVWMTPAKAKSTGLGIESEGKEVRRDELPPFEQDKIKTYPMVRDAFASIVSLCLY